MYNGIKRKGGFFMVKLSITMDEELLKKVDEEAKKMYLSRSAFISLSVVQKMQQDSALDLLPKLLVALESQDIEKQKQLADSFSNFEQQGK